MADVDRKRRPQARPQEILTAALELFSERGFSAARLEDVAARARLSKAAIYLYFPDKASLLRAIIEETAGANVELLQAAVDQHHGPVGPLLKSIIGLVAARIANSPLPHLIKLIISEARAQPELGQLYIERSIGRAAPIVESIIRRGMATGEFRNVDAFLTVRCIVGPMLLAAIWRSVFEPIGGDPLDVDALARQHADLILNGISAHTSQSGSVS